MIRVTKEKVQIHPVVTFRDIRSKVLPPNASFQVDPYTPNDVWQRTLCIEKNQVLHGNESQRQEYVLKLLQYPLSLNFYRSSYTALHVLSRPRK